MQRMTPLGLSYSSTGTSVTSAPAAWCACGTTSPRSAASSAAATTVTTSSPKHLRDGQTELGLTTSSRATSSTSWSTPPTPSRSFYSLLPSSDQSTTAECFARLCHRLGVCLSVSLSGCLSYSWAVSKRCKLGSRNLHCGLPQGL